MRGIYKTLGIAALSLYSFGCSTTGENLAKTVGNALITPARVVESTVKELDPVKGARRGALNTVESLVNTVSGGEAVQPEELGKYNTKIEENPLVETIVDMGASYGLGYGIAKPGTSVHRAKQIGAWSAAGEAAIKAGNNYKK